MRDKVEFVIDFDQPKSNGEPIQPRFSLKIEPAQLRQFVRSAGRDYTNYSKAEIAQAITNRIYHAIDFTDVDFHIMTRFDKGLTCNRIRELVRQVAWQVVETAEELAEIEIS